MDYVFRRTIGSFIGVPSAFCKRHFAYALIFNVLSSEPGPTVPVVSNRGPELQHRQPASPLELDAEEQQVPPSSPTPAASESNQLLVGVDTMKIGA